MQQERKKCSERYFSNITYNILTTYHTYKQCNILSVNIERKNHIYRHIYLRATHSTHICTSYIYKIILPRSYIQSWYIFFLFSSKIYFLKFIVNFIFFFILLGSSNDTLTFPDFPNGPSILPT